MSDWLAGIAGGARGASQGLGDLIAILDRANAEKKADARYADERDYRNRSLDADLAKSGYFPADDAVGLPAIDKNIRAAGRPNLVTMAAERGAPERSAPSSLFDGVDISGILSRAASGGGDPPIGLDPTTAGKDLHQVGDPNAPALPSSSPTPRTNVGNSPVHRALALAGQTEPQQSVSIGGKKYFVDPDRTPEGRRATAQLAKDQQLRTAKHAENVSRLTQLRNSNPTKYADLSDALIDLAADDDDMVRSFVEGRAPVPGTPAWHDMKVQEAQIQRDNGPAPTQFSFGTATDASGQPVVLKQNVKTGEVTPTDVVKPATQGGKGSRPTEAQMRANLVLPRVEKAAQDLEEFFKDGAPAPTLIAKIPGIGGMAGNFALSEKEQRMVQAAETAASGILRLESGAAITESEVKSYARQFLPEPGDSPQVRAQKRASLQLQLEAMRKQSTTTSSASPAAHAASTTAGPAAKTPTFEEWKKSKGHE